MREAEIAFLPATEQAARIRAGEVSPVEVLEAAAGQWERFDPLLNAVVTPAYEQARETARQAERAVLRGEPLGPLHGLPIAIKDTTPTAGLRTTYGSKLFEHHVPAEDALLVQRLRAAGGIIVGKTNTPEFEAGINTRNPVFGATRNPWNPSLACGGSSGGSAVALATGMCALAQGSDHGGSLRIPASLTGVVGFRLSTGRVPTHPSPWLYDTFSGSGPMARTVPDVALMLAVLAGPDRRAPLSISEPGEPFAEAATGSIAGWRVAWSLDLNGLFTVDAEVASLTTTAAERFATFGCAVESAGPELGDAREIIAVTRALYLATMRYEQLQNLERVENQYLKAFIARVGQLSALDVARAEWQRSRLWERVQHFFERYDLLLLPSTQMAAFPIERDFPETVGGRPMADTIEATLATYAITLTSLPAISIPCGFTPAGLPVGLQIVGRWRQEADVLRAAAAFEAAYPWHDRRPPILETSAR